MAKKQHRFNFRYDESFMQEIDDWRVGLRPVPSRSEAIRLLASRGVAVDKYLSLILENSLKHLITTGLFSEDSDSEIYERFQEVVTKSLDAAAGLDRDCREDLIVTDLDGRRAEKLSQETPSQGTSSPKTQRYSR